MNAYIVIVIFQVLSFALIFLEVLIPSGGIISLLALGSFAYSWYNLIEHGGQLAFLITGLVDIICIPLSIYIGFKALKISPFINQDDLSVEDGYAMDTTSSLQALIGKSGVVISQLRPSGKIEIDDQLYDALSEGEMIDSDTEVTVLTVSENKIIVEPKQTKV